MRKKIQSRRRRLAELTWDMFVWLFVLVLTLAMLAGCASCPPCKTCPKCNAALQGCESDLSACIDLATRCNKE